MQKRLPLLKNRTQMVHADLSVLRQLSGWYIPVLRNDYGFLSLGFNTNLTPTSWI